MGQAPRGYYRCSGYQGIPVHLLLGPFISPALAQGRNCRWILCRKNTGYHATNPKDSNAGG
jgi:hypothetical protein